MHEEVWTFGETNSLVGILSSPAPEKRLVNSPAIILANSGLVHRVGPHRLYVKIARMFSENGFLVLRFDFSGLGDSDPRYDNLPQEKSRVAELQDAMNELASARSVQSFILMGICSGAVDSFQAANADPRVVGLVQINPPGYDKSQVSEARWRRVINHISSDPMSTLKKATEIHRYLGAAAHLYRAFNGKWQVVREARRTREHLVLTRERFLLLLHRSVEVLFIYSAGDSGLYSHHMVFGRRKDQFSVARGLRVETIQDTDHVFSSVQTQEELLDVVLDWTRWATGPSALDIRTLETVGS